MPPPSSARSSSSGAAEGRRPRRAPSCGLLLEAERAEKAAATRQRLGGRRRLRGLDDQRPGRRGLRGPGRHRRAGACLRAGLGPGSAHTPWSGDQVTVTVLRIDEDAARASASRSSVKGAHPAPSEGGDLPGAPVCRPCCCGPGDAPPSRRPSTRSSLGLFVKFAGRARPGPGLRDRHAAPPTCAVLLQVGDAFLAWCSRSTSRAFLLSRSGAGSTPLERADASALHMELAKPKGGGQGLRDAGRLGQEQARAERDLAGRRSRSCRPRSRAGWRTRACDSLRARAALVGPRLALPLRPKRISLWPRTPLTQHAALLRWADETAKLTKPDQIVWRRGERGDKEEGHGGGGGRRGPDSARPEEVADPPLPPLQPERRGARREPHADLHADQGGGRPHQQLDGPGPGLRQALRHLRWLHEGAHHVRGALHHGPASSPFSKVGIEVTDWVDVALNMGIMTRMERWRWTGSARKASSNRADQPTAARKRWIVTSRRTATPSGRSALVTAVTPCWARKRLALRINSYLAKKGWLAEHRAILQARAAGRRSATWPPPSSSACGRVTFAMMIPAQDLQGLEDSTCGDRRHRLDARRRERQLWAVNPENGYFGVAPGTNRSTNPDAMESVRKDLLFTNVARTKDGDIWWEGWNTEAPASSSHGRAPRGRRARRQGGPPQQPLHRAGRQQPGDLRNHAGPRPAQATEGEADPHHHGADDAAAHGSAGGGSGHGGMVPSAAPGSGRGGYPVATPAIARRPTRPMQIHAIVLAGGDGNRFGAEMPKQFVRLAGEPILLRTLRRARRGADRPPGRRLAPAAGSPRREGSIAEAGLADPA